MLTETSSNGALVKRVGKGENVPAALAKKTKRFKEQLVGGAGVHQKQHQHPALEEPGGPRASSTRRWAAARLPRCASASTDALDAPHARKKK